MRPIKVGEEQFRMLHALGAPVFWAGLDDTVLGLISEKQLVGWADEDLKKNVEDLVLAKRSRKYEQAAFYTLVDSDAQTD